MQLLHLNGWLVFPVKYIHRVAFDDLAVIYSGEGNDDKVFIVDNIQA